MRDRPEASDSSDARAAARLLEKLRDAHPDWAGDLRLLDTPDGPPIETSIAGRIAAGVA
jgi:hypothetical protein